MTAFISPYQQDRAVARELHEKASIPFIEVFVDAPLSVVEARDPKGLYKKARAGEIKGMPLEMPPPSSLTQCYCIVDFTGVSAPYEAPENPEIHIRTDETSVTDAVKQITEYLVNKGYIYL